MVDNNATHANHVNKDNDDQELWERMIVKRRRDCECLNDHELANIVENFKLDLPSLTEWTNHTNPSPTNRMDAIESLLRKYLRVCSDDKVQPKTRRESYNCLRKLLGDIDQMVQLKKHEKSNGSKRRQNDIILGTQSRGKKLQKIVSRYTGRTTYILNQGSESPAMYSEPRINGLHQNVMQQQSSPEPRIDSPLHREEASTNASAYEHDNYGHGSTETTPTTNNIYYSQSGQAHSNIEDAATTSSARTIDDNNNMWNESPAPVHQQPTDDSFNGTAQPSVVHDDFAFQWSLFGLTPDDNETERIASESYRGGGGGAGYLDTIRSNEQQRATQQQNAAMNTPVFMTAHEAKTRSRYVYESRHYLEKQNLNGNLCWLCHLCNVALFDSDVQTHCGENFHVENLRNRHSAMRDETLRGTLTVAAAQWAPQRYTQPTQQHIVQQHLVQPYQRLNHMHQDTYPGYHNQHQHHHEQQQQQQQQQQQYANFDPPNATRYNASSMSWHAAPSTTARVPQAIAVQPQLANLHETRDYSGRVRQNNSSRTPPQLAQVPQNGTSSPQVPQIGTSSPRSASQKMEVLRLISDPTSGLIPLGSDSQSVFVADSPQRYACTVHPRDPARVSFRLIKLINGHVAKHAFRRLTQWEPFWITESALGGRLTSSITDCNPNTNLIQRATELQFDFSNPQGAEWLTSVKWGQPTQNNERVLLLRMLPLNAEGKKRADCHLWPKGTFVQVNGQPVMIEQRRQQRHDLNEWKGMCKPLNVSELIKYPAQLNKIELCCCDDEPYIFMVALCRQRGVEEVFQELMNSQDPSKHITEISPEQGKERAVQFARCHKTVSIDSDVEDESDVGKFIFTLTCPISKMIMEHPVRGKECKHWQCFDLRSYIISNFQISGSRWRCAACENFVALQSLEYCQFTRDLLVEFAQELSTDRDRVEFCSTGEYRLLEERKLRYGKRKNIAAAAASTTTTQQASEETNIIDLD